MLRLYTFYWPCNFTYNFHTGSSRYVSLREKKKGINTLFTTILRQIRSKTLLLMSYTIHWLSAARSAPFSPFRSGPSQSAATHGSGTQDTTRWTWKFAFETSFLATWTFDARYVLPGHSQTLLTPKKSL